MAHTKECLAEAIIAAVENMRDISNLSSEGFRALMVIDTGNGTPGILAIAEDYLADGTKTCRCHSAPDAIKDCGCYADDTLCPHDAREDEDSTYDPDDPHHVTVTDGFAWHSERA